MFNTLFLALLGTLALGLLAAIAFTGALRRSKRRRRALPTPLPRQDAPPHGNSLADLRRQTPQATDLPSGRARSGLIWAKLVSW